MISRTTAPAPRLPAPIEKGMLFGFSSRTVIVLSICLLVSGLLVMLALTSNDVWLDEACSLLLVEDMSPTAIRDITAQDVHPPLFYWILRSAFCLFPKTVATAKLVSAIPCIVLLFSGALFLDRKRKDWSCVLFPLFFCASAPLMLQAIEIRMYAWAALFVTLAGLFVRLVLVRNHPTDWLGYVLCAELAAWTHYFAAMAVFFLFAALIAAGLLLRRGDRRQFFLCSLGAAFFVSLFYLPWVAALAEQFSRVNDGQFWVSRPSFGYVFTTLRNLFACGSENGILPPVLMTVSGFCWVRALWHLVRFRNDINEASPRAIVLIWGATPLAISFAGLLYSWFVSPVFIWKYAIPAVPLLLLSLSETLAEVRPRGLMVPIVAALAFAAATTGSRLLDEERTEAKEWEKLVQIIDSRTTRETQFLYPSPSVHEFEILAWRFPGRLHRGKKKPPWIFLCRPETDWKAFEDTDWSKPWCLVIREDFKNDFLPAFLQSAPFVRTFPARNHYPKGWRLYFGPAPSEIIPPTPPPRRTVNELSSEPQPQS